MPVIALVVYLTQDHHSGPRQADRRGECSGTAEVPGGEDVSRSPRLPLKSISCNVFWSQVYYGNRKDSKS